jgi:F-type H+-transporting ATPase subunit b
MDNPLVQPDPGLFIWTIVTFLLLVTLLAKFAWRPLLQALDARREGILQSLEGAKQAKRELDQLKEQSAEIMRDARIEAEAIVSKSWSDAEKLKEEMKEKARTEADAILREARRQIQVETAQALKQIRNEVADLSVTIASKLIQRNFSKEDNDRLIEETLRQIEAGRS